MADPDRREHPGEEGERPAKPEGLADSKVAQVAQWVRNKLSRSSKKAGGPKFLEPKSKFMRLLAMSMALHVGVPATVAGVQAHYKDVIAYLQKEDIPEKYRTAIEAEMAVVEKRNERRMEFVEKNAPEAEKFKSSLVQKFEKGESVRLDDAFFEMEKLSQGVAPEIVQAGRNNFDGHISLLEKKKPAVPDQPFLQKVYNTFISAEAGEDTRSSAAEALALMGEKGIQNCTAREKIIAMALARLYPDRQKDIFTQKFGDHTRVLFKVGDTTWVMDRDKEGQVHPLKVDEDHEKETSIVTPIDNMVRGYAGAATGEVQVFDRGESEVEDYPVITDNIIDYGVKAPAGVKLGNVGSLEKKYGGAGGASGDRRGEGGALRGVTGRARILGLRSMEKRNEQKLADLIERMQAPMELTLLGPEDVSKEWLEGRISAHMGGVISLFSTERGKLVPNKESIERIQEIMDERNDVEGLQIRDLSEYDEDTLKDLLSVRREKGVDFYFSPEDPASEEGVTKSLRLLAHVLPKVENDTAVIQLYLEGKNLSVESLKNLDKILQVKNVNIDFSFNPSSEELSLLSLQSKDYRKAFVATLKNSKVPIIADPYRFVQMAGAVDPSLLELPNYQYTIPMRDSHIDMHRMRILLEAQNKISPKNKERLERFIRKYEKDYLADHNPSTPVHVRKKEFEELKKNIDKYWSNEFKDEVLSDPGMHRTQPVKDRIKKMDFMSDGFIEDKEDKLDEDKLDSRIDRGESALDRDQDRLRSYEANREAINLGFSKDKEPQIYYLEIEGGADEEELKRTFERKNVLFVINYSNLRTEVERKAFIAGLSKLAQVLPAVKVKRNVRIKFESRFLSDSALRDIETIARSKNVDVEFEHYRLSSSVEVDDREKYKRFLDAIKGTNAKIMEYPYNYIITAGIIGPEFLELSNYKNRPVTNVVQAGNLLAAIRRSYILIGTLKKRKAITPLNETRIRQFLRDREREFLDFLKEEEKRGARAYWHISEIKKSFECFHSGESPESCSISRVRLQDADDEVDLVDFSKD